MSQPFNVNTCPCIRENQNNPCLHVLPIHYFAEPAEDDPHARHPCGICARNVADRNKAFQCNACKYWNHIRCDGILPYDYDKFNKLPQDVCERQKDSFL